MPKRITLVAIAIAFTGALLAPGAQGGQPERFVLPPFETFVDFSCPESIAPEGIEWSDGGGNFAVLIFDDGGELRTGRHPDVLTNVATGESIHLDLQGSMSGEPVGDGFQATMRGTNGFLFLPGDVGPGNVDEARIYVFTGTVRMTFSAEGYVSDLNYAGQARDVCAEL